LCMGDKEVKKYYVDGGDYDMHLARIMSGQDGYFAKIFPDVISVIHNKTVDVDFSTVWQPKEKYKTIDDAIKALDTYVMAHKGKLTTFEKL
jgi:hypothetical protein